MKYLNEDACSTEVSGRIQCNTDSLAEFVRRNRNLIFLCLAATFVWGMITHSYIFLHSSFSHDSLNEFNAEVYGNEWRIQLGRVFVPAYRVIVRSSVTLPWVIGILSLLYIGFTVFLTVKVFNIRCKVFTVLISGIFTANITVIATAATYIHDLDCNMLSLALAVMSVYLWKKWDKGYIYGMVPLCLSIGLYQSYISVAITMIILYLVMQLLNGEAFGKTFKQGIKGIGMILGAGVLYYISVKIICYLSDVAIVSGNYNSMDRVFSMSVAEIYEKTMKGYTRTFRKILNATSLYPKKIIWTVHAVMMVLSGAIILFGVFQKDVRMREKVLTIALVGLLPFSMNIIYPLTDGMSHNLMEFGFWLVYLLVLLLVWWVVEHDKTMKPMLKSGLHVVSVCLVMFVLWGNVQTANAVYLKKDLEQQANLSLFTRIMYEMENCDGYVTGETPVVFVGSPDALLDTIPGFEEIYNITGNSDPYVLYTSSPDRCRAYFDYVLLNPAVIADSETWSRMKEHSEVAKMPCYPEEGSIAIVDNILVAKLGE